MIKACKDCIDMIINEYADELHLYEPSDTICEVCEEDTLCVEHSNPYDLLVIRDVLWDDHERIDSEVQERVTFLTSWSMYVNVNFFLSAPSLNPQYKSSDESAGCTATNLCLSPMNHMEIVEQVKKSNEVYIFTSDPNSGIAHRTIAIARIYNVPYKLFTKGA